MFQSKFVAGRKYIMEYTHICTSKAYAQILVL